MWAAIKVRLLDDFKTSKTLRTALKNLEKQVKNGEKLPFVAARELLAKYLKG